MSQTGGDGHVKAVIFQALTHEVSDTAHLDRLSRIAARAVYAETNTQTAIAYEQGWDEGRADLRQALIDNHEVTVAMIHAALTKDPT